MSRSKKSALSAHQAQFKMRPVCGMCHRVFAPAARKAGFGVCLFCRSKGLDDESRTLGGLVHSGDRALRYRRDSVRMDVEE